MLNEQGFRNVLIGSAGLKMMFEPDNTFQVRMWVFVKSSEVIPASVRPIALVLRPGDFTMQ